MLERKKGSSGRACAAALGEQSAWERDHVITCERGEEGAEGQEARRQRRAGRERGGRQAGDALLLALLALDRLVAAGERKAKQADVSKEAGEKTRCESYRHEDALQKWNEEKRGDG